MTNAEKYLKDGVEKENLAVELVHFLDKEYQNERHCYTKIVPEYIVRFFEEQIKPILSEDEKVILKNIDNKYATIGRDEDGLFIAYYFDEHENDCNYLAFNKLFQFINLGEEYEISDLLGDEDNG